MAPGEELGRFRLEEELADASWRARDAQTGATVRLRIVEPLDEGGFFSATRSLCKLSDPHVLGLIDAGLAGEVAWVAEPWPPSETLAARVARTGAQPVELILQMAEVLLSALGAAHARAIRDGAITPERLRISAEAPHVIQLAQPGLGALLTDLLPDPDFAPPEGSTSTVAADLYGAAATLCFAALGRAVPSGEALALTTGRLPATLVDALAQCLDPDPRDRPHSSTPLLRAVQVLRTTRVREEPRPAEPSRPPRKADPSAPTAAPPRRVDNGPTLPESPADGSQAPTLDISAAETLPPPEPKPKPDAGLTQPMAPPVPTSIHWIEVPEEPAGTPAPVLPTARAARKASPAATDGKNPKNPFSVNFTDFVNQGLDKKQAAETTRRTLYIIAGSVLALGVAAVVVWWAVYEPPPPPVIVHDAEPTLVVDAQVDSALPAKDPLSFVRVVPEPGPARFVQVPTGLVVCEEALVCEVPIDVPTRIEKAGFTPKILSGDDLYDRRGNRWRVKLYPGR